MKKEIKKKARGSKKPIPSLNQWLDWTFADKIILMIYLAQKNPASSHRKIFPPKLVDKLHKLENALSSFLHDRVIQQDAGLSIIKFLKDYRKVCTQISKTKSIDFNKHKILIKKNFDSRKLDVVGEFKVFKVEELYFSKEDFHRLKSNKDTKILSEKNYLYSKLEKAVLNLPSERKLDTWKSKSFFAGIKETNWDDAIMMYINQNKKTKILF
ncbi:MAG: hypothetical protein H7281_17850 [Bacteriovorax sp.]|nr:hypothetical protein [Bacteriovorax sp.]